MSRSYLNLCRISRAVPVGTASLISRISPARSFARSAPTHVASSPGRLQEVKYVRFGDSNSSGNSRWRPLKDGKWDTPSKLLVAALGAGGLYHVAHLERVEETGRWRFIDISVEQERKMGKEADEEFLREFQGKILHSRDPRAQRVTNVASRIISSANLGFVKGARDVQSARPFGDDLWSTLPGSTGEGDLGDSPWQSNQSAAAQSVIDRLRQEWEVYVINDDKTPNAFVTGGGKIFVFTGILPIAANDDGIATVIGHEIAHQVERHSAEKISGMKVFGALVLLLEVLGLDIGISRIGLTLLMTLPNSRTMESEADNVGLRLMAQACYDPRESVKMWERMSQLEAKSGSKWFNFGGGDFLQTHPANEKRIKALENWIPSALSVRASSTCAVDGKDVGDEFRSFREAFGGSSSVWA